MRRRRSSALLIAALSAGCNVLYDEGSRFASQVADFALEFRQSTQTVAVFEYKPLYGIGQHIHVGIGRIQWCPKPPCDNQGAATVIVERGKSGTGYRIQAAATVPEPLEIDKFGEPVRVLMRKAGNVVEIVGLQ